METRPDNHFLKIAIEEAEKALAKDEVPVGAVIVANDIVIARAHNLTETLNDSTAHAEMMAITSAEAYLGSKYLEGCTLYVTVEPCPMCAGAIFWSQIDRVVYGCSDPKRGFSMFSPGLLHGRTEVSGPVMEHECSSLMVNFFKNKR